MLVEGVGEFMSFQPSPNKQRNPIVPLPPGVDLPSILSSVDRTFVTHTHLDHFDDAAVNELPKDLPIFCQPANENRIRHSATSGFSAVYPVKDNLPFDGIEVFRTDGQHGPLNIDSQGNCLGPVSGFVLRSQDEPTLYIAGDTIWCPEVEEALERHQPDIVVVNAGAAQMLAKPPAITMTKEDVARVCRYMPSATVIAVHMEAIDHCLLHRKELEDFIENEGLSERIRIPADGESMEF
jgi:L-ascorbate metabolism protein UlaG (beta-lactamase superfamily)